MIWMAITRLWIGFQLHVICVHGFRTGANCTQYIQEVVTPVFLVIMSTAPPKKVFAAEVGLEDGAFGVNASEHFNF